LVEKDKVYVVARHAHALISVQPLVVTVKSALDLGRGRSRKKFSTFNVLQLLQLYQTMPILHHFIVFHFMHVLRMYGCVY
jgi:hypothetical protein